MPDLYVDGGVIQSNPSRLGGAWAWCLVDRDRIVRRDSGIIEPGDMGVALVTNNQTELLAAVRGLEAMSSDWAGTLYTDSKVTLARLQGGERFNGVPNWLRIRTLELRRKRRWVVALVAGRRTQQPRDRMRLGVLAGV